MDNFLKVLNDLYGKAINAHPKDFVQDIIQLARQFIDFDGAFYGAGLFDPRTRKKFIVERGYVYQREDSLLKDYIQYSDSDPIMKKVINGSQTPFFCAPEKYYEQFPLPELAHLAARHRIKNLLIHGHFPRPEGVGRWLALFRDNSLSFESTDVSSLKILWPHLFRSIEINLHYALHNTSIEQTDHASGLVNSYGVTEAADPVFSSLLKLEWPAHCENCIPELILPTVIKEGIFHGQQINLCGVPHLGYLMCTAQRALLNAVLSSAERKVAHCFARGMTNKEIALQLGTSPHTVRMQLKSVYYKLNVHNKIGLARAME
jgi:DNA-binding CsgD family transcriptional regulator